MEQRGVVWESRTKTQRYGEQSGCLWRTVERVGVCRAHDVCKGPERFVVRRVPRNECVEGAELAGVGVLDAGRGAVRAL